MNQLHLFLPCAAGVEGFLADEVHAITGASGQDLLVGRGGVMLRGMWRDAMLLNLHSRLAQRVLIELSHTMYRSENDLYRAASEVAWEIWFSPKETFKIEVTAQHSPLTSLNFAALKVKDAIADRFRAKRNGVRPSGDAPPRCARAPAPDDRRRHHLHRHLGRGAVQARLARGQGRCAAQGNPGRGHDCRLGLEPAWRQSPAAVRPLLRQRHRGDRGRADRARIPAGILRRFAFEKLVPFQRHVWEAMLDEAEAAILPESPWAFTARTSPSAWWTLPSAMPSVRAWPTVSCAAVTLQRMPPSEQPGMMLLNPPYGERIAAAGSAAAMRRAHGPGRTRRPRNRADRGRRRILQPAGQPLEEELQRLERLDADARPQAARQDAPQGVAPHAHVERPHRMPSVPLRHGQGLSSQKAAEGPAEGAAP
jgi:putative N6-adenine-specific DNA methylase